MEIVIIAAVAKNGVIGKNRELPWHIPHDLKRFKELTFGHSVIMGRNTLDSIIARLGKPLPGRKNIVLTSQDRKSGGDLVYCKSMDEAIEYARNGSYKKAFIMGGQRVFEEGIKIADRMELTLIQTDFEGDVYFPKFSFDEWAETARSNTFYHGDIPFSFASYERRKK